MYGLRDYQIEMLNRVHEAWRKCDHVLVQMPTGTGKTILLASLINELACKIGKLENEKIGKLEGEQIRELENKKRRDGGVLIVAHRRELIEQIQETVGGKLGNGKIRKEENKKIREFGDEKIRELEDEKRGDNGGMMVWVESIQTLSRHLDEVEMEPELVVVDEAHHALARTYRALWERWPRAKFLGLTATPCRLNGAAFTDLFDVLLQSKDIQWFIRKGWLSDFEYVSVQPDSEEMKRVRGLKKRGADGDYQQKEMATVLDVPESIAHLYSSYNTYARGKKGIVYAINRAHAQHIAEYYSARGVRCAVIDATTPAKERKALVEQYKGIEAPSGASPSPIDVLINVDIFSEGFDCPEVEFIQLARPTLSLAKYLQQVGRGMRVSEGKPFVTILDQVGLYQTFGLPTDSRDWIAMFQGRQAGKGLAGAEERPLIIRDEVADRQLVNLEMLHIKRFDERRTRIEVFLQGGRFGIMRTGHVTCAPQFRRVKRLHHPRYYALAVYEGRKEEYITVIDNEGCNLRMELQGEVSVEEDIFIERTGTGSCTYYDAISKQTYLSFPVFRKVAGLEVMEFPDSYILRDWQNKLVSFLRKDGTRYNEQIVVTEGVLINKTDGNRQSRIQGYLEDSILVTAERGIGYQQVFADGHRGHYFERMPEGASWVPDWRRLGLQRL